MSQSVALLDWRIFHQSPIDFFDFTFLKEFVHSRQSLARLCKDHQTAHRAVDAMNDTAKHIARFGIFFFEIVAHNVDKRLVAGLIALHDFAGSFVDNYQMIVFVNYLHTVSCPFPTRT